MLGGELVSRQGQRRQDPGSGPLGPKGAAIRGRTRRSSRIMGRGMSASLGPCRREAEGDRDLDVGILTEMKDADGWLLPCMLRC